MTVVGPTEARHADGLAVDFVVESDRAQLSEIVQRVRDGRLRTNIGNVATHPSVRCALAGARAGQSAQGSGRGRRRCGRDACNHVVGMAYDDVERLRRIAEALERAHSRRR